MMFTALLPIMAAITVHLTLARLDCCLALPQGAALIILSS